MEDPGIALIRYGGSGLLSVKKLLHAGSLTAELLDDGSLRYIKLGNKEIIRCLYAALRDRNWATVPFRFLSFDIEEKSDAFTVVFTAEHRNEDIHFVWTGRIAGNSNGTIKYSMDGQACNDFYRNRLGFCMLQPTDLAATLVELSLIHI